MSRLGRAQDAILHILDGLIAKNRVRDALHEAS
jgi:hypothetical protein